MNLVAGPLKKKLLFSFAASLTKFVLVFGSVLVFVYTNSCQITEETISELLNVGDMFLLPGRCAYTVLSIMQRIA